MVFYISKPERRNYPIVDCEYYWDENWSSRNKRYEWNLDVHTTIIASNLLKEIYPKIQSGEFTEEQILDLCKDIDDLREIRGWLWEKSDVNRTLDKTTINCPASSAAEKKGREHIENVLKTFADKWGYELYYD